jgi:transposase
LEEKIRLDVGYDLGYATVEKFHEHYVYDAYTKVFSLGIGVGAITFDKYQKHAVITEKVFDILCEAGCTNREEPL